MELSAEEKVTKLLSEQEIIRTSDAIFFTPITESAYNLGEFLKNYKAPKSPYEGKYVFIR